MFDRLFHKNKEYIVYQFNNDLTDYYIDEFNKLWYDEFRYKVNSNGLETIRHKKHIKNFSGDLEVIESDTKKRLKFKFNKGKLIWMKN